MTTVKVQAYTNFNYYFIFGSAKLLNDATGPAIYHLADETVSKCNGVAEVRKIDRGIRTLGFVSESRLTRLTTQLKYSTIRIM